MPIVHAIVLGITQGLTEFLPVSSSGHLLLVPWLFGWNDLSGELNKTFDVALHMGTFLGVLIYFRKDLGGYFRAALRSLRQRKIETDQEREAWLLLASAVPAAVTGALFESFISEKLGQIWLIAVMLIVFGLVLLVADRWGGPRTEGDFRARDALIMGLAQAAALQPGVSRSGITMTVGLFRNFSREAAARISFLMSIPIIGGAGLFSGAKVIAAGGIPPDFVGAFFWGFVASAITGFLAIFATLRYLRTHSFAPFVAYRVVVGVGCLALLASNVR